MGRVFLKFDNLRAYAKHLKACTSDQFADLYLISIKERFEREEAYRLTIETLLEGRSADLALKRLDAESASLLLNELNTMPFLLDRKVVAIQQAQHLSKSTLKEIEGYLSSANRRVKLVLCVDSIAPHTSFYKRAERSGVVLSIAQKKGWERERDFTDWVYQQVQKEGKQIEPLAVQLLVKQTGLDQFLLQTELEKLLCFCADEPVLSAAALRSIGYCVDSDTIFQLVEALLQLQGKRALTIYHHLKESAHSLSLVLQIRAKLQIDYQICSTLLAGGSTQEISQQFPYLTGRILQRRVEMAMHYGLERFKRAQLALDEVERAIKQGDHPYSMEKLLITLAKK